MKKLAKIITAFISIVFILLIAGLGYFAWHAAYPSGTWRYKMTVTVETPEGLKTGSAVREVSVHTGPRLSPHMLPTVKLEGEAIVVDLGQRGVLFALLSGYKKGDDYAADIPAIMFSPSQAVMSDETVRYMSHLKAGPVEVPAEWYPKFVYFKDMKDPKTLDLVIEIKSCANAKTGEPDSSVCLDKDRFGEIYGEGVRLGSVLIEMTEEPVTTGIEKYLFYGQDADFKEWYRSLPYGDPRAVARNSFKQGK